MENLTRGGRPEAALKNLKSSLVENCSRMRFDGFPSSPPISLNTLKFTPYLLLILLIHVLILIWMEVILARS